MANRFAAASARSPVALRLSMASRAWGPKPSRASPDCGVLGFDAHRQGRSVVAFQHAGGFGAAEIDGARHDDRADILLQRFARDAAGTQQRRAGAGEIEHGGFDADLAGAAIEDHRHILGQLPAFHMFGDMARRGRADPARRIGATVPRPDSRWRAAARARSDDRGCARRGCRGRRRPAATRGCAGGAAAPGSADPARQRRRGGGRARRNRPGGRLLPPSAHG